MNIRRIISILALSAFFGTGAASAQGKFEINGGFGFAPLTMADRVETFANTSGALGSIYAPLEYDVRVSGTFGLEGSYRVVGKKLIASLMLSYGRLLSIDAYQTYSANGTIYTASNSENVSGHCLALLQRWKYEWIQKPDMRLYSSVGFGIGYYKNFKNDGFSRYSTSDLEFQFVPVGIAVGQDWFWFVEAGVGTQYTGGRAGVGFRF